MALNYLSGLENAIGAKKDRKKKRDERKTKRKEKRSEKKAAGKGVRRKVAKIGLAPSRAAFLLAVRLNLVKLAKRLKQAYKKDPSRIEAFWTKLGGKFDALKEAIETGSKSKLNGMEANIGIAPEVAAATALPVIIAVIKVFNDLRSDEAGDTDGDNKLVDDSKKFLSDDAGTDKGNAVLPDGAESGMVKGEDGGFPIIPVVAVAAAGLYFATKKK